MKFAHPRLWSIEKPNRYVVVTTVEQDGKVVDSYETPFGIRTIRIHGRQRFFAQWPACAA